MAFDEGLGKLRQTQTHRQAQTDTDRHRQTQTGTEVAFDEGLGKHRQTQTDTDRHRQTQVLSLLNIILSAVWAEHGAGILVIGSAACAEH